MSLQEGVELNVTEARWISGLILEVVFSDGGSRKIDFGPFLTEAAHPDIRKYFDTELFKEYSINYGNLVWGNYDLCFPIEDLYSGCLTLEKEPDRMVAEDDPEYRAGESGYEWFLDKRR